MYASADYLARHGEPLHPDDLQHHKTLAFPKFRRNGSYYWPLNDGERDVEYRIDPVIVANDPSALTSAMLSGEGLLLASDLTAKAYVEQGYVQRVLAGWTGPLMDFNALFPRGQAQSPKVRAFVDFLVERLNFEADYMRVVCPDSVCGKPMSSVPGACATELAKAAARQVAAAVVPMESVDASIEDAQPVEVEAA